MASIFLSHSWNDKFFVRKLADKLRESGVTVWIDEAELKVGDSLIEKVSEAISTTDYLGAILSHSSVASSWVQQELQQAMTMEIMGKAVVVLPILIEKCQIPAFLKHKVYADFTDPNNFDGPFQFLLKALGVLQPVIITPPKNVPKIPKIETTRRPSKLENFVDISINSVDKDKTYRPDPSLELYNVYFLLSHRPSQEWVQIFDAERRFPRHSMWRRAWIEGQYVVVNCGLSEIKKYHLNDIKVDVLNSNVKFREYLQQQELKQQREDKKREDRDRQIDDALDGIEI